MSNRFFQRLAIATCVLALAAFQTSIDAATAKPKTGTKTAAKAPAPATYKGAIVINAEDGTVLFEDNADVVNPPASVTKLMTFLLVNEAIASGKIALDTTTNVTREEARFAMKKGSTSVWLNEKETFPVEELLYAMMIRSANDAALVLSRTVAGSSQAFVEMMNIRAKELGLTHTRFVTPHGLTPANIPVADGDLTAPRDLAILAQYLIAHTDVLKYTSVRSRPFGQGTRAKPVDMTNHNHLLGKVTGVDGLKTGFTDGAGFCLAATAERKGNRIIAVTMGTPDRISRDTKITELMEAAFAKLPPKPAKPISPVSPVSSVGISGSTPVTTTPAPATPTKAIEPASATTPAQSSEIPQILFPSPPSSGKPRK